MTGTLVRTGQRFVDAFFDGRHLVWILNLSLWLSLSVGAIAGAVAYRMLGIHAIELLTLITLVTVAINQLVRERRRRAGLPLSPNPSATLATCVDPKTRELSRRRICVYPVRETTTGGLPRPVGALPFPRRGLSTVSTALPLPQHR